MRIYVHIPFCESKCVYCAFASVVGNVDLQQKYFQTLLKEIEQCKENETVQSIYIGGGTPSCVDKKFIEQVLDKIKAHFRVEENAEITLEANSCSLSEEKLKFYKDIGINRLSIGVQSLNNKVLKILGRKHNKKQVFLSLKNALQVGFTNVSVDLLIGLKNTNIKKDCAKLLKYKVKHISAYMLQVEENTPLKSMIENGSQILKNDDECVRDYENLAKFLQKRKMQRYEISNFAFEGYESQHNIGYWVGDKYIGFGLSAHSYDGNFVRTANASDFETYFKGERDKEVLSKAEKDEEIIMLGLRCKYGFDLTKLSFDLSCCQIFKEMVDNNILLKDGSIVKPNPKHYGISNTIILKLLNCQ